MQANARNTADLEPRLTPKQEKGILALLSTPTLKEAAGQSGVNEATLFRWLQNRDFHAAYMKARRESFGLAVARLQQASCDAVGVLQEIINDRQAPASARVNAAKAIIDYSSKALELEDLAERVAELESTLKPGEGAK
jgi:hypothetical protein